MDLEERESCWRLEGTGAGSCGQDVLYEIRIYHRRKGKYILDKIIQQIIGINRIFRLSKKWCPL